MKSFKLLSLPLTYFPAIFPVIVLAAFGYAAPAYQLDWLYGVSLLIGSMIWLALVVPFWRKYAVTLELEEPVKRHSAPNAQVYDIQDALLAGKVELALQPIMDTRKGTLFAYEALTRFRDKDGFADSESVIAFAEASGLVRKIDECIFEKGIVRLSTLDPRTKMFFNFSAATLADHAWMRSLPARIAEAGALCEQVVIEITEREEIQDMEDARRLNNELCQHGIQFALDDFGSGYSSFLYIRALNIKFLKIDGSFIQSAVLNENDRMIVEHMHAIAQSFGLRTIAEHVEDRETAIFVDQLGIQFGQGFYFGKPTVETGAQKNIAAAA